MTVCTVVAVPLADVARVVLTGEIDLANRDTIAAALRACVTDPDVAGVGIDLAGVTFIDVAGIRALATSWHHACASGKTMRVAGGWGRVAAIPDIIGGPWRPADAQAAASLARPSVSTAGTCCDDHRRDRGPNGVIPGSCPGPPPLAGPGRPAGGVL